MDGYKSKNIHHLDAKRKRESSPQRRELGYRGAIPEPYRERPGAFAPSCFAPTGNNRKVDRYVSRGVHPSQSGKPIPTGPRSQRERQYRHPYQSVGIDSRSHQSAGPGGFQQNPKNNHGNNSPLRNHKPFTASRGLESQEEYKKKSIARHKHGYRDSKGIRKEKHGEILQIEFAKRDAFSPIESISTADDERNREFTAKQYPTGDVVEESRPLETNDVSKLPDKLHSTLPSTVAGMESATDGDVFLSTEGNMSNIMTNNNKNPAFPIDHTCLPAPVSQAIYSQFLPDGVEKPELSTSYPQSEPIHTLATAFATAPEAHLSESHLSFTGRDSPMSTSAMSISSGSSPAHSPACNSPITRFSPSRSSTSTSPRGKASTCILCKGPAAPPLKALVRCIECRHNYHTHCHTPRITMTNGKFDVDVTLWVCSRCTKSQRVTPMTAPSSVNRIVAAATPNRGFRSSITPTHKRRKVDLDSPENCNGETLSDVVSQGSHDSLTAGGGRTSYSMPSSSLCPAISQRSQLDQFHEDMKPKDWSLSRPLENPQVALQCSLPSTGCLQGQASTVSASTILDSQAEWSRMAKANRSGPLVTSVSSNLSVQTRYTQNMEENRDDLDDEEAPMDLDSPPRSPHQSPEPEPEQLQITCADSDIDNNEFHAVPLTSEASAQSPSMETSIIHPGVNKAVPVVDEGTETDTNSPPYSPRLDDELPGSPIAEMPIPTHETTMEAPMTGALEQTTSSRPSSLLQKKPLSEDSEIPPLPSLPLPLIIPPVGPTVPHTTSLRTLLGPTTTVPCANCGVLWPMFVNVARPDGRNYCVQCLCIQQRSPREGSVPLARESVREHRPLSTRSNEHRSPSHSLQTRARFERDGSNSSLMKNAQSAATRMASPRPSINSRKPEVIDQPVEKIITAQQLMEDKYKKHPEIFPTNSRFSSSREIEKGSEETPAANTPIKDRSEGKDGPRKKLTVSEYALRQKEKEKGLNKVDSDTSLAQDNVGHQETEDVCNHETPEAVAVPVDITEKSGLNPAKATSSATVTTPVPQTCETETVVPGNIEALRQLEEKLSQEIEQWKKKFEEQRGFVSNYVKHNAKIMGKLSSVEQQKLVLEKKAAALEAEITTHRRKQEQLKEENEKLRQKRLEQEEEELRTRVRAELAAAEARAKAMHQASQGHSNGEKNAQEEEGQGHLMKNVYKDLTFDIVDPLEDIAGDLSNVPGKPTMIPKPRYSATRKSEVLNFNYSNLRSLHLHREVDRTSQGNNNGRTSDRSRSSPFFNVGVISNDKSRRSMTSGESSDGKTMSFEEFARIPQNMVPVLKDGVLAFRAGQLNPRTRRLDRSVNCYKVGRDVPGELRGIR